MGYNDKWELFSEKYKNLCTGHDVIPDSLFKEYGVNRGLRDINGNGVLTGLTNISRIDSFCMENGKKSPAMESSGIGDTMSPIWYSIFQRIPSDLKK